MTAEYHELDGSPQEIIKQDSIETTRRFKCAWNERHTVAGLLLGSLDPMYSSPGDVPVKCHHISIQPHPGKNLGENSYSSYELAIITANYSSAAFQEVSESFEPSGEFMTVPTKNLRWSGAEGDELEEDEHPGRLVITMDYLMAWRNLTYVPAAALNLIGHINSLAFNPANNDARLVNLTFDAETLLYHPPTIRRHWDYEEQAFVYDLSYRFTFRPNWFDSTAYGWNYFWRPKETGINPYERIWDAEAEAFVDIYPSADFGGLIS